MKKTRKKARKKTKKRVPLVQAKWTKEYIVQTYFEWTRAGGAPLSLTSIFLARSILIHFPVAGMRFVLGYDQRDNRIVTCVGQIDGKREVFHVFRELLDENFDDWEEKREDLVIRHQINDVVDTLTHLIEEAPIQKIRRDSFRLWASGKVFMSLTPIDFLYVKRVRNPVAEPASLNQKFRRLQTKLLKGRAA